LASGSATLPLDAFGSGLLSTGLLGSKL